MSTVILADKCTSQITFQSQRLHNTEKTQHP